MPDLHEPAVRRVVLIIIIILIMNELNVKGVCVAALLGFIILPALHYCTHYARLCGTSFAQFPLWISNRKHALHNEAVWKYSEINAAKNGLRIKP